MKKTKITTDKQNKIRKKNLISSLIDAVIENNCTLVHELLMQGANPNGILDAAKVTALHHAAQSNSLEVIHLLIEAGANIFAETEPDGLTPIDIALLHNNDKAVQMFVAYCNNEENSIQ